MSTIEAGIRGGGIAIIALLALFAWRDARHVLAARYYVPFLLTGICYLIESAPELMTSEPAWLMPVRFFSNVSPPLFQLWAWSAFDDGFRPSPITWLPTAAMAALVGWAMTTHEWLPWRVVHVAAVIFVCIGLWQILSGRRGDLVEGRRQLRLVLAIVVGLVMAGLTIHAAVTGPALRMHSGLITAGIVLALALLSAILHLGFMVPLDFSLATVGGASPGAAAPAPVAIDPEERGLLERLRRLMEEDRIYREEDFGIAVLAERMSLPEYRLRRLINQRLAHRNFSSYVNGYRLAETVAALSDPTQAQVPILTIALDAGFQSIGPFNRAFKAQTGMTPTDFRRERIERSAARAAE